jgi:hypothetical protein
MAAEEKVIDLHVRVIVHDPERLKEFARGLYQKAWSGPLDDAWPDAELGRYLYEALVASNGTPESPLDYGIEIDTAEWEESEYT